MAVTQDTPEIDLALFAMGNTIDGDTPNNAQWEPVTQIANHALGTVRLVDGEDGDAYAVRPTNGSLVTVWQGEVEIGEDVAELRLRTWGKAPATRSVQVRLTDGTNTATVTHASSSTTEQSDVLTLAATGTVQLEVQVSNSEPTSTANEGELTLLQIDFETLASGSLP